jgi:PAS domain S-box-containing protein
MNRQEITVLYIEDDDSIIDLVTKQLDIDDNVKFKLIVKKDMTDVIEFMKEYCVIEEDCNIDVILMDLVLPTSDGVSTFKTVKDMCSFLPIVILSGFEEIACKCVALGAQDYLIKTDITPRLLIRSLKYAIERNNLKNKVRNIIDKSTLGYHLYKLVDENLIFVGYNPAAESILGVDHSSFIDKNITDIFPNLSPGVVVKYKEVIETGHGWSGEIIPYKDDNITHEGYYKVVAYRLSTNRLAVSFEDVTEQFLKEKQLKESEEKYRTLVEATGVAIFGVEFHGETNKFTYVNEGICEMLGYTKDEMMHMTFEDILTEKSRLLYRRRLLALKLGKRISSNIEYSVYTEDRKIIWLFVTSDYIEDKNSQVVGANYVAIDITDRKKLEINKKERINRTYSELEDKIKDWNKDLKEKHFNTTKMLTVLDKELSAICQPKDKG